MEDILCPFCGEPWDGDLIHEIRSESFNKQMRAFKRYGCGAWNDSEDFTLGALAAKEQCTNEPIIKKADLALLRDVTDFAGNDLDELIGLTAEFEYMVKEGKRI